MLHTLKKKHTSSLKNQYIPHSVENLKYDLDCEQYFHFYFENIFLITSVLCDTKRQLIYHVHVNHNHNKIGEINIIVRY